jgi:signal transduction histidine kinase
MTAEAVLDEQQHALTHLQNLSLRLNVSLSLEETLDAIIEAVIAVCRADRAAISYFNKAGELLIMRHRGLSDDYIKRRQLTRLDPAVAKLIQNRQPLVIENIDEMAVSSPNYAAWKAEGIASIVTLPLVSEGEMFGVLGAGAAIARRYSQTEINAMAILAAQASAAIVNARLFEKLREANRAKDEFLSTLSHELRTPLTPILGWTHLLRPHSNLNNMLAEGIDTIERNANQLASLINDLLDVTRIVSGKVELAIKPVDLSALIESIVALALVQARSRNIHIESNLPREPVSLDLDAARIGQALSNLLDNAMKFTPDGGHVRVSLECDRSEAIIKVADTGIGIDPEFLPRVFERFAQAHGGINRRYGGLGLGLAITKAMVEIHGGSVAAESEGRGCGSRFIVRLPLANTVEQNATGKSATRLIGHSDNVIKMEPLNLRVLLVEDSRDTINMMKLWLESLSCEVLTASSAIEGERLAVEHLPDLIISDIGLPEVDGYELMRRLRNAPELARVPAIALTGYARAEDRLLAEGAGYDAHIAKPAEMVEMIELIRKLAR